MVHKLATIAVFIAGAFVSMLIAQEAPAPQRVVVPVAKAKRACTFVVGFRDLRVYYERALVVAKKEVPAGEPDEFWIVFPDRREQKRDTGGHIVADNVPADQVLFTNPHDGPVVVVHRMKVCRCPPMLWGGGGADVSAEH